MSAKFCPLLRAIDAPESFPRRHILRAFEKPLTGALLTIALYLMAAGLPAQDPKSPTVIDHYTPLKTSPETVLILKF